MESQQSINDKYTILERKGHGASADVYLVKDPNTNKIYAAKVLKESNDLFDKEVEILKALKPTNIPYMINLIDSGNGPIVRTNKPTETKQYLVLEYGSKGELFNYIYFTQKGLQEKYSKVIFAKILKGIQACHKAGICHRDLKMQNILVDGDFNPKICDFGFATYNTGKLVEFLGTLNYAAPEILLRRPYDGFKADIFSLGVVLLTLTTCKIGFSEATKRDPYYRLIMTKHFGRYWEVVGSQITGISEELKNLYNKMVSFRPQDRPSIDDILNDDWMKEIRDLSQEQFTELENQIRQEFMEREIIVNEKLRGSENTSGESSIEMGSNRGADDENEYFNLNLYPSDAQTGLNMNNYIKINGELEPIKFMNKLANKVKDKFGENCDITADKNHLKFNVKIKEEEKEEEEIPKELEEELAKLGLEDNEEKEEEEEEDELRKKDCILQVRLFKSINGGHLLRFMKKDGELEDYYKNLTEIQSLIKRLL